VYARIYALLNNTLRYVGRLASRGPQIMLLE
jgi:hypothetical protein